MVGSGWPVDDIGKCMKSSNSGLVDVDAFRLPGWDSQGSAKRWLGTICDMAKYRSQWSS